MTQWKKSNPSAKKIHKREILIIWCFIIGVIIYLVIHETTTTETTPSPRIETPAKETKTKAQPTKVKQEITLESATFEEISNTEKQTLKTLTQEWSTAHNDSTINDFNFLFDDFVQFYGTRLSKKSCIENKENLLQKYTDFHQEIYGDIDIEQTTENECRCNFTKRVIIDDKTTDYPSYLVFKKTSNQWKIITESDLVTDKNLAKKKK
jgi:hypothetical protein